MLYFSIIGSSVSLKVTYDIVNIKSIWFWQVTSHCHQIRRMLLWQRRQQLVRRLLILAAGLAWTQICVDQSSMQSSPAMYDHCCFSLNILSWLILKLPSSSLAAAKSRLFWHSGIGLHGLSWKLAVKMSIVVVVVVFVTATAVVILILTSKENVNNSTVLCQKGLSDIFFWPFCTFHWLWHNRQ